MSARTILSHSEHDKTAVLNSVAKLQNSRKERDREGVFFIEGARNFLHAANASHSFVCILKSDRLLKVPFARKLSRELKRDGVPTLNLSPEEFRSISRSQHASGIAAIIRQRWFSLDTAKPDDGLFWIALGRLRSPGNFGTLMRTAEAIGGAGFILLDSRADPYSLDAIRGSMAGVFHQRFVRASTDRVQQWAQAWNVTMIGASPEATISFHDFRFPKHPLIMLGEERQGMTDDQRDACDSLVTIPMTGVAEFVERGHRRRPVDVRSIPVAVSITAQSVFHFEIAAGFADLIPPVQTEKQKRGDWRPFLQSLFVPVGKQGRRSAVSTSKASPIRQSPLGRRSTISSKRPTRFPK